MLYTIIGLLTVLIILALLILSMTGHIMGKLVVVEALYTELCTRLGRR